MAPVRTAVTIREWQVATPDDAGWRDVIGVGHGSLAAGELEVRVTPPHPRLAVAVEQAAHLHLRYRCLHRGQWTPWRKGTLAQLFRDYGEETLAARLHEALAARRN